MIYMVIKGINGPEKIFGFNYTYEHGDHHGSEFSNLSSLK